VLVSWFIGLPVFAAGLAGGRLALIALGAAAMLVGTALNAGHIAAMTHRAASREP
jgi:hypothetical protein